MTTKCPQAGRASGSCLSTGPIGSSFAIGVGPVLISHTALQCDLYRIQLLGNGVRKISRICTHRRHSILPPARGRCSNWWWPRCDMFPTEDQWAALMYCEGHLQSTICGRPGNLFSWALPGHHKETLTACSECNTGMGDKEWFKVCSPPI